MTTHVAVTFDIEFDINGTFAAPRTRTPQGAISLTGQPGQPSGLPVILDILDHHGVRATFFVEALQASWFGLEEMGRIVELLSACGHEIQLHLHPAWLIFDKPDWISHIGREPPRAAVHDTLINLSHERVTEIIQRGKAAFVAWGQPEPVALRTGSLFMERHLYSIFRASGLTVSSSVGLGIHQPEDHAMKLFQRPRLLDGVLEIPVSSYIGTDHLLRHKTRLATLIGMGLREQRTWLAQAAAEETPVLVLLSHASEFHKPKSVDGSYQRNTLTERKFEQLCHQLTQSPSLKPVTISEIATTLGDCIESVDTPIVLPREASFLRFLETASHKVLQA
ncbi:polysaccharide deacetylase family protein [Kineobactrum sediminis]|nr:polysaccharide deacetylase family protein [Kineobactrum sediminis]